MFNLEEAWQKISKGDASAKDLCRAVYLYVHTKDDLIDRDKPVKVETAVGHDLQILREFGKNPFFQKHQDFLWPLLLTSAMAYISSEDFKRREDVIDKIASQVLKSQYVDIFIGIAFCIGGFDHALAISREYRDYHYDVEKPAS